MAVDLAVMRSLVGRPFPGGTTTIPHWESVLLADVVVSPPLPPGLVHPAACFHAPLAGMGMTYAELFALCHAEADDAVRAGEYVYEIHRPLVEDTPYRVSGGITGVERKRGARAGLFDKVTFALDMTAPDGMKSVTATNSWLFLRDVDQAPAPDEPAVTKPAGRSGTQPAAPPATDSSGEALPEWRLAEVSPEKMKILAAILRDPNPIHWDRSEVAARGLGDRVINQGPTNVGYVLNMLMTWVGAEAIERIAVRFTANVFEGDSVVAGGTITDVDTATGRTTADAWLDRGDGTRAVTGQAIVWTPDGGSVG